MNLTEHLEAKDVTASITEPKGESGLTFIRSADTWCCFMTAINKQLVANTLAISTVQVDCMSAMCLQLFMQFSLEILNPHGSVHAERL